VGQLHPAFKQTDLVEGLDIWGETGMDTEDLAFNDSSDAEVVEDISAILPRVGIAVFSDSLIVEAVSSRNLSRFVITAKQGDPVWVLELQAHQILECL
jgi:hypothetical protein